MGLQDQYKLRDVLTQDTILLLRKLFTDGVVVNSSSSGLSLESTLQDVLSKLIELEIDINDKNVTFLKNGIQSNVVEDDVTPANNIPLPVKITSATGPINITAGDLNVQLTDQGVNYDITRIGNGTNQLKINSDGSINNITQDINDKVGLTKTFVYYTGIETGNPSGNKNVKTITYGGVLSLVKTFTYDSTDNVLTIINS